jgi:L-ribulose-5-phosphate 4-epimerase
MVTWKEKRPMADPTPTERRERIVRATRLLSQAAVLSASGHGNVSERLPEGDEMLLTSISNIAQLSAEQIARVTFAGAVREGALDPASAEIVAMHAVVYGARPDVGAVIHTHSPHVTAYALAHRPLPCRYEALLRQNVAEDIPVAAWGPRGSAASVTNIADAIQAHTGIRAVLLANHGLLAFGTDALDAARVIIAMEEAAQMTREAEPLGGAQPFPPGALEQVRARIAEFANPSAPPPLPSH